MKRSWRFIDWLMRRFDRDWPKEFAAKFPGRCAVCAYHAFGLREGMVKRSEPVPAHADCVEKLKRWSEVTKP